MTNIKEDIILDAEKFCKEEVAPYSQLFEKEQGVSRELLQKMGKKGYLGAVFPKEYGGLELDSVTYGMLTKLFSKACCATRAILTVHTSLVGETLLKWGTPNQKEKWLPLMARGEKIGCFALTEPDVGSDAKSIKTNYKLEGDYYILNGVKKWITFGNLADFFLVIASNDEGKQTAFIVEREFEGVSTQKIEGLLAGRGTHIAEIHFDQVKVPKENLIGKDGIGFTYIANYALDCGRYSIAWSGLGLAEAALSEMVRYSRQREQFGKKIYTFQLIQEYIGNAVTQVHAAQALCLKAGEMRNEKHPDAVMESTIAKYFTSKVAFEVATNAVQVHGANGCINEYKAEQLFREAKTLEIIEGSSQIQQQVIAQYGLRNYYKK